MAKPREPKRGDATRRWPKPVWRDAWAALLCCVSFWLCFSLFLFSSIFAVVVVVFFSISFNTLAVVVAGIQHVSDFGQSKKKTKIKEPQWIWYHFIHKQSILLCTLGPTKWRLPPPPLSLCISLVPSCLFSSFSVSFVAFSIWKLIRSNGMIWWFLRSPSEAKWNSI